MLEYFACGGIFGYLTIGKEDKDCTHFFGVSIKELQVGVVAKMNFLHKQPVNLTGRKGLVLLISTFNVTNDGSQSGYKLATTSHEVRSKMNRGLDMLQILMGIDHDANKSIFARAHHSGKDLVLLINDVFNISKWVINYIKKKILIFYPSDWT